MQATRAGAIGADHLSRPAEYSHNDHSGITTAAMPKSLYHVKAARVDLGKSVTANDDAGIQRGAGSVGRLAAQRHVIGARANTRMRGPRRWGGWPEAL
jgi:hypothetical protein